MYLKGTKEQLARRGNVDGKSFKDIVEDDLATLNTVGVSPDMDEALFERKYLSKLPQSHGSHSYVGRGLYSLQLRLWLSVFPRNWFHFVLLEDLKCAESAQDEMSKVFEFLHLDNTYKVSDFGIKNGRKYETMPEEVEKALSSFYAPFNKDLEQLLSIDLSSWQGDININLRS